MFKKPVEDKVINVPPLLPDEEVKVQQPRTRQSRIVFGVIGLVSVGLIIYPFWPELVFYSQQAGGNISQSIPFIARAENEDENTPIAEHHLEGRWLAISQIGVDVPLVEGEDVGILDQKNGVWHQAGNIGQSNLVLAGHRFKYLPPNTSTLYHLNKLQFGDKVSLWWDGQEKKYEIVEKFTVGRDAIEILNPTEREQLTIYTCEDINASKRLVIVAVPVK